MEQQELKAKADTHWDLLGDVEKTKRRIEGGVMFRLASFFNLSYKSIKEL